MNKDDLKALGIEDEELAKKIIIAHGKDIETIKASETAANEKVVALTGQLTEAGNTIESFKKMDVAAIQKAADDYKTKYEQAQQDAEKQVKTLKFDHALEAALSGAKAKNLKAVRALLDVDKITLAEDGKTLEGLEEQLTAARTSPDSEFLFEPAEPQPKIVIGSKNDKVIPDKVADAARAAAGLPTK